MLTLNTPKATEQNIHLALDEVLRAVQDLKNGSGFGSIEIVMHEGLITQIEKREKLRIQAATTFSRK